MITKNIGSTDKIIRVVIAIILGALYFTGSVTGVLGIVLLVVAVMLILTSLIGFCGIYKLLGIKTCPVE